MGKNKRFLCIHGHFYQPPRENPWLDRIERQDSAAPFQNWNERILSECYYPNSASRILDGKGKIRDIVNNYSQISFNIGPTLLSWIRNESPDLYTALIDADRESIRKFSGHGNAIAQAYNHTILPLSPDRYKKTQIVWGIRDFRYHFKREPEGMWLPELAVDTDTLNVLADSGIRFIILSQYQADAVQKTGESFWKDVRNGGIDTTRAYRVSLGMGRHIDVFFYNAEIARGVAFEGLLDNGGRFLERLKQGFSGVSRGQIVNIATDGESYGHHHRFGEMALSYALQRLEKEGFARITNYGEFLEKFPPEYYVKISEESSWSCAHGIGRWKEDCGCSTGGGEGWNQKWREPLRGALNWLQNEFETLFKIKGGELFKRPLAAEEDYILHLLDNSEASKNQFFSLHQKENLTDRQRTEAFELLEMQRYGMFMFTSCGWFFNDISGLETVQILEYAKKGMQHFEKAGGNNLVNEFLRRIRLCKSNIAKEGSGEDIFKKYISPHVVSLQKLVAQYAVSNHIFGFREVKKMFGHEFVQKEYKKESHRGTSFSFGHISVKSLFTQSVRDFSVCCFYMGGFDFTCKVHEGVNPGKYGADKEKLFHLFSSHQVSSLIREIGERVPGDEYSVSDLLFEERAKILNKIIEESVRDPERSFFSLYDRNKKLMDFFYEIKMPVPPALKKTTELALTQGVHHAAENISELNDVKGIEKMLADAKKFHISLDKDEISKKLEEKLVKFVRGLSHQREKNVVISLAILKLSSENALDIKLWRAQTYFFEYLKGLISRKERQNENDRRLAVGLNFSTKILEGENNLK